MRRKSDQKSGGSKFAKRRTCRRSDRSSVSRTSSGAAQTFPSSPGAVLDLAEQNYLSGQEAAIVGILSPLQEAAVDLGASDRTRYLALLAMGYAHANKLIDAEEAADKLALHQPQSPDPWFVLTFVRLSMREYKRSMEAAERYIELLHSPDKSPVDALRVYSKTAGHQSQLYNMFAAACKESGLTEDAITHYRRAIEADRGNHLPYLNLATLLGSLGRSAEASEVIKRGVKNARQVQELRMMQQSSKARATVSACMIVKDEEEMLGDCLHSIRDWVDEIILVDTGSTDRTVEIAQSYGAKVFHHAWEGDFSKARNQSLAYATGNWIFIIDADERMLADDLSTLRPLLDDKRVNLISINVFNVYGGGEAGKTFLPSVRFFRRSLGLKYDGIVHNILVYPEEMPVVRAGVRLKHLGYGLSKEKMQKKLARSRVLLEQQLAENPDNAFALFNYAQLLRGETATFPVHNANLILKSALRAIELTSPTIPSERHIHLMCLDQIAWTHFHNGDYQPARQYATRALTHKANYLDPLLLLGHIAAREQSYDEARTAYERYLAVQTKYDPSRETDNLIIMHVDSRVSAWYSLGMIAELQGDALLAEEYYERIEKVDPGHLDTCAHLGRLAQQRNDATGAAHYYRRHLQYHPHALDTRRRLGQLYLSNHLYNEAEETFRLGLKQDARDIACITGLGRTLAESGKVDEARAVLERALESNPGGQLIKRELASVQFRAGLFRESADQLRELLLQSPEDADLLNDLGNACAKLEQLTQAIDAYRRALQCPNPPAIAWRNLGVARARSGDHDGAAEAFEAYLEHEPDSPEIISLLIELQMTARRFDQALVHLENFLKANPRDAQMMFQLAECYLLMGHTDSAILGYRRVLQLNPRFSKAEDRLTELSVPSAIR